ncbi:universal stress protein [Sulfurifustis variabilis]|uniref:Universal stress protein n=1 Tax=Sulfurifustis variabilis TaxID=1675686 RepID=A0A1C7AEV9_9GAMM|nr:universal stress protein [Sulfurifustis variabilis]BAU49716.1 universal stress protein [Sulfurifustis variabilis]
MTLVSDILVPLDGSREALKGLGVATWLGARLGARVHVLNAGEPLPEGQALARLGVPEPYRPRVEVHQTRGAAADTILAAAEGYRAGLVVMTARGESAAAGTADAAQIVGHVTREVIERSRAPVLVLPPVYEEALPWRSALVPLSGEARTDESLTLALHLAHALNVRVAIAHVADTEGGEAGGRYADELHHEFAQSLNELVARACPLCSAEERSRIEAFHLAQGDIAEEIERLIGRVNASVLVVGWHGDFMVGHAQVLKMLIRRIRCPLLLVKPQPREPFRLKVGEAFG